jgi:3-hydroxyacyl-CoA dehydrogenase
MLDKGVAHIRGIYEARVEKGKMSAGEMASRMDLIIPTLDYGEFADVDIVIEAVPEKMGLKQRIFQDLDKVCPEGTIYASNTSALSITEMAARPIAREGHRHAFLQSCARDEVRDHQGEDTIRK